MKILETFPESLIINQKIFKKQIYENADILAKDRQLFIDVIDTIQIALSFKPENSNIPAYKTDDRIYDEIQVLYIELKKIDKLKRITDIIMRTIPYPMIIIYSFEDRYAYYLSHLSINKSDPSKNTIDELFYTDFITENIFNMEIISQMDLSNMYVFYDSLMNYFKKYEAERIGVNVNKGEDLDLLLKKITKKEAQIAQLKAQIKKEKQFNHKFALNVEIKKLEKEILALKGA